MPFHKVIRRGSILEKRSSPKSSNISQLLMYRSISGGGLYASYHVNPEIFQRSLDLQTWNKVGNPIIKFSNYNLIGSEEQYYHDLQSNLEALSSALNIRDESSTKVANLMVAMNFMEMFSDILANKLNPESAGKEIKVILEIMLSCLDMIPNYYVYHLRENLGFMEVLFSFYTTKDKTLYNAGTKILVEILNASPDAKPLSLHTVKGLGQVMQDVNGCAQAAFYQVLFVVLSEVELFLDIHSSLQKHDEFLCNTPLHISGSNHEFLLSTNGFLKKMFQISSRQIKDISQNEYREMLFIFSPLSSNLNQLVLNSLISSAGDNLLHNVVLGNDRRIRENIFFILSILIAGKFKEQIQEMISKTNFVQRLDKIVEEVIWNNSALNYFEDNADEDRWSQQDFLRIQFLRLLHIVFDSHKNRFLFLSKKELTNLRTVTAKRGIKEHPCLNNFDVSVLTNKPKGILSVIIEKLKLELNTSHIRFWILRCLESFLRGNSKQFCQYFLLEKNLLEDSLNMLICGGPEKNNVRQGNFDFLSMLIHKNIDAIRRCEAVLDCQAKFSLLLLAVKYDLVDSNTFIRAIILTNNHIKTTFSSEAGNVVISSSKLLKHFSSTNKMIEVAASLLSLLTVPTISQGNVSCLNTSVLILVLAHQEGKISVYLQQLFEMHGGIFMFKNLKTLLTFWIEHYSLSFKKSDCESLESGSGIKFTQWKSVVEVLLNSNSSVKTSLDYYISNNSSTSVNCHFSRNN